MDEWAADPALSHVAFFCICVEAFAASRKQTASLFRKELKLKNAFVGYFVDDADMPRFGQLGCQGFILAAPDGCVLVPRSPPWLEHRSNAISWLKNTFKSWQSNDANLVQVMDKREKPAESFDERPTEDAVESHFSDTEQMKVLPAGGNIAFSSSSISCEGGACSLRVAFESVASVQVSCMDEEHAESVNLLRSLEQSRDQVSLQAVRKCLAAHFQHEEALLAQHGFGTHMTRESHAGDHAVLLKLIDAEALACTEQCRPVGVLFLQTFAERFAFHTSEYDMRYADCLKEAGAF